MNEDPITTNFSVQSSIWQQASLLIVAVQIVLCTIFAAWLYNDNRQAATSYDAVSALATCVLAHSQEIEK